jgi:hypothetical protein
MRRRRLVRLSLRSCPSQLPVAVLVAIALFAGPDVGADPSITSRILIDPAGEHTGDEFGRAVTWVGDVNGDGHDDLLVGAFRYPEIQSHGLAYLYFGGTPALPPAVNGSVSLAGDASATTISWTDLPGPYSVYRGTRNGGSPWVYNQTCHDSHIPASNAADSANPPVGTMFFYLVTRIGACGDSIPGQSSGGQPIPNPSPCP